MSTQTVHSPFHASGLTSGRTGRRVTAHPRTIGASDTAAARTGPASPSQAARPSRLRPADEPQILRRWSVAGLIASAPRPRRVA